MLVLKSDNANGLFGFGGPCQPVVLPMSVSQLNCTVGRGRGSYDTASLLWRVTSLDVSVPVSHYFVNYTGHVVFAAQQTTAVSLTFHLSIDQLCIEIKNAVTLLTG